MHITLSKYAGFCEGVTRACDMVENIAKDPSVRKPIFVLGSLVHNDDVVQKFEAMDVQKISMKGLSLEEFFEKNKDKIGTLVITAHGIGPEIYGVAKKYGVPLVDTTCPRVIKVQRLAKTFHDRGTQIVIIGEKNHKEVVGIGDWADKEVHLIETDADLKKLVLDPNEAIAVISQTTQNQEFVNSSAAYIKDEYPQAEIVDSICMTTHDRQTEIKQLANGHDVVIAIGSPESGNSTRLWEIAKSINPQSYFIQRADELQSEWFSGCQKVAVTAGASTPSWIIDGVIEKIKDM